MKSPYGGGRKLAELTSGVGAAVIGVGLGALLSAYLMRYWVIILLVGVALHSWGMYNRHAFERNEARVPAKWEAFAYWICWIFLIALTVIIGIQI